MPIRFRCAYCNQLMGIASRKAGTVVKCPKCAGEIIVPALEETDAAPPEPSASATGGQAFEEDDFARYLDEPANGSAAQTEAPLAPKSPPKRAPVQKEPERRGLVLSWGMLFVAVIVVILLLILMFVLGMVIGKQSAAPAEQAAQGILNGNPWNVAGQRGVISPAFQRSHSACISRTRSGICAARSFS